MFLGFEENEKLSLPSVKRKLPPPMLYNIGVYCSDILLEKLKLNAITHKNLNIPVKENKIIIETC